MVQIKVEHSRTPDVVPEIRVDEPTTLGGGPSVSEGTSSGNHHNNGPPEFYTEQRESFPLPIY